MTRALMAVAVVVVLIVVVVVGVVLARAPQAVKPGGEIKKLGLFLGSWNVEGELKPGNGYGVPAGKVTQVERFQWMPGEFFLQMNRDGKGSTGDFRHMVQFGHDPGAKKYTLSFFDLTTGGAVSGTGTNNGNTWTWMNTGHTFDGKGFQERCTVALVPNASYTIKCDTSTDGKNWSPSFEGKATKSRS
jgi:hypothetical protein